MKFAIDTDAHSLADLTNMRYGVAPARFGGLTVEDVINAWPLDRLEEFLRDGRSFGERLCLRNEGRGAASCSYDRDFPVMAKRVNDNLTERSGYRHVPRAGSGALRQPGQAPGLGRLLAGLPCVRLSCHPGRGDVRCDECCDLCCDACCTDLC